MTNKMVYSRNFLVSVLNALERTRSNPEIGRGICTNVSSKLSRSDYLMSGRLLKQVFKIWPEFSGHIHYPIVGTAVAYYTAIEKKVMWEGEYGAARYRLLDFTIQSVQDMIDYIDEQLEAQEENS